ncbi:MAG TPA: L,D-transpeptidase family protein [Candidatus Paceibacterota bacterium]
MAPKKINAKKNPIRGLPPAARTIYNVRVRIIRKFLIPLFAMAMVVLALTWKSSPPPTPPDTQLPESIRSTFIYESPLPANTESKPVYIEVVDTCGPYYEGACLNARSGPGTEFPAIAKLRNGIVLRVANTVEAEGRTWYKIVFDEWLRYPERITTDWYVAADYVRTFQNGGMEDFLPDVSPLSTKRIIIDRSEQMLYAYDVTELFMQEQISTGLELTPTPRGTFRVFRKTPSRYMQGPIPNISEKVFDLPGVPWNLYFTEQGAVIHGAYWHDHFGEQWSNGCVNLPPEKAKQLYEWADIGTIVVVRD